MMPGGFRNKPKILRGAFVEFGLSIPPLVVAFQFNPVQLTRNHSLQFSVPNTTPAAPPPTQAEGETENSLLRTLQRSISAGQTSLRQHHQDRDDLLAIREDQQVTIQEETISFEIRLDATDKLNDGDVITEQFGIAPQLATLEAMVYPKEESLVGAALLGKSAGFSFTKGENPPMMLFIWGGKRVLPVNINSMNVTETEFSTDLDPIRALALPQTAGQGDH
jgi:hypothetical protein